MERLKPLTLQHSAHREIKRRDAEGARAALRKHVESVRSNLRDLL